MKFKSFPRRYALIQIKDERKVACWVNEEWIIDSTCKSINEMLKEGLVGEDAVQGWINLQPAATH
ncbi:hypothetical protein IT774_07625 [Salinimonas marina]|uniref:Uncharacterized protein n=2 Tax=Salinimonas marina TaxID=2785918 RepID=A0A7S9HE91_9ALTE|nr:hypothetical protein IT774_07625 [Salinimonas marina]